MILRRCCRARLNCCNRPEALATKAGAGHAILNVPLWHTSLVSLDDVRRVLLGLRRLYTIMTKDRSDVYDVSKQ